MPLTFEQSKDIVAQLVKLFAANRAAYRAPAYKEAHARQDFIDPLFVALGWDVRNEQRAAPDYREVVFEDSLEIEGQKKAPDYVFRVGRERKFFAEAKKPGVDLKHDARPAYQLRRYAWTAKLPLSLLTDFEELAVYDCRARPTEKDKAAVGRINYYHFSEYADRWRELWDVFSREAVYGGSFDQYTQTSKGKRGTSEVDAEFLKEIESWREAFARNLALRNPRLGADELSDSVQRIIDRIIFLRMAEDRGIEDYGRLARLAEGENIYSGLVKLFKLADARYNSGLFDFSKAGDTLTPTLKLDDKTLKPILSGLYFPQSPYEFSVLPVEILGNVYEQFLGKVIRLTAGHQAKIEEKPEVKKAGGVYYTPAYIVEYIVKNTLGKQIEGKSPAKLKGFRVLDPACGSGSFLLGAYQYLLDYYLGWYTANAPEKHPKAVWKMGEAWRLTTAEKKRILTEHIYGVDIDRQAVEVTKLSLLLKVLETENDESMGRQLSMFEEAERERALPNLDRNIKCGNSLIGPDYFDGQLLPDADELKRVNPFDWAAEFPEVFSGRNAGFDCVIGNPPYGAVFGDKEAAYFRQTYDVFSGVKDVYTLFIEKSVKLLGQNCPLSFIVPSAWLGGPEYKNLREFLLRTQLERFVLLPFDIFADAYVDTVVFVTHKGTPPDNQIVYTFSFDKKVKLSTIDLNNDDYQAIQQSGWSISDDKKIILNPSAVRILEKLKGKSPVKFENIIQIKRGVLFDKGLLTRKKSSTVSFRYFEGDVYRYELNLIAENWIEFNDQMKERPREMIWFDKPRLLLRRLVNRRQRLMSTFASEIFITNKNLYSVLPIADSPFNLKAILGILNSRLISYLYINQVTQATKDDFPQVTIKDVLALPFPENLQDKARHDRMVALVEQMLELHKRKAAATGAEQTRLQRLIDSTDQQIDALVYELYGLTPEEIAVVEGRA